jgi:hypothetical protein
MFKLNVKIWTLKRKDIYIQLPAPFIGKIEEEWG